MRDKNEIEIRVDNDTEIDDDKCFCTQTQITFLNLENCIFMN